jgi:hypothetical protein
MTQPLLFSPFRIRDLTLKNRIAVAPMHQYSAENGFGPFISFSSWDPIVSALEFAAYSG